MAESKGLNLELCGLLGSLDYYCPEIKARQSFDKMCLPFQYQALSFGLLSSQRWRGTSLGQREHLQLLENKTVYIVWGHILEGNNTKTIFEIQNANDEKTA